MIGLTLVQELLAVVSGILVGFSLGLIGGGGSILAIPLLLYFVGLSDSDLPSNYMDHVVIGTTALAVGLNAYLNAGMHFRRGDVDVKRGVLFAVPGALGAVLGGLAAHFVQGELILFSFGFVMIAVALIMLRGKSFGVSDVQRGAGKGVKYHVLLPTGVAVGLVSGLFGIGGGFLVVPGLIAATGLCMKKGIGTSLIAVGTFGVVSALTYALFGEVDYRIALLYLVGGIAGGYLGAKVVSTTSNYRLKQIFAAVIIVVAIYVMFKNAGAL
jgi:uncharacterized membrane protein YfcA